MMAGLVLAGAGVANMYDKITTPPASGAVPVSIQAPSTQHPASKLPPSVSVEEASAGILNVEAEEKSVEKPVDPKINKVTEVARKDIGLVGVAGSLELTEDEKIIESIKSRIVELNGLFDLLHITEGTLDEILAVSDELSEQKLLLMQYKMPTSYKNPDGIRKEDTSFSIISYGEGRFSQIIENYDKDGKKKTHNWEVLIIGEKLIVNHSIDSLPTLLRIYIKSELKKYAPQ